MCHTIHWWSRVLLSSPVAFYGAKLTATWPIKGLHVVDTSLLASGTTYHLLERDCLRGAAWRQVEI